MSSRFVILNVIALAVITAALGLRVTVGPMKALSRTGSLARKVASLVIALAFAACTTTGSALMVSGSYAHSTPQGVPISQEMGERNTAVIPVADVTAAAGIDMQLDGMGPGHDRVGCSITCLAPAPSTQSVVHAVQRPSVEIGQVHVRVRPPLIDHPPKILA